MSDLKLMYCVYSNGAFGLFISEKVCLELWRILGKGKKKKKGKMGRKCKKKKIKEEKFLTQVVY